MKIYKLHTYAKVDGGQKTLQYSYHSTKAEVKSHKTYDGKENCDGYPIDHDLEVINLKNKKEVIAALNNLAEAYTEY